MGEYLCIGDYICLYCEDTQGFVYSDRTSETCNGLIVYQDQDREDPSNIPNVHVITFQVFTQNRYKLTKKYRKLVEKYGAIPADPSIRSVLEVAQAAAESETQDNIAEQRRLRGKRLRYGEIIQLRHVFTDKFIHVSTTETSRVDKNKMMVMLETFNSKHAQFRILPRCKVKAEGEPIEVNDQVVIESVKSPATFLHASEPYQIDRFSVASELNLGVEKAGFTVVHHYRPDAGSQDYLRGGSVTRLFHKDLEAYLVSEGLFGEESREDVHLRIREINQMDPRTLYPPRSGITYWQVESIDSVIDGRIIRWEEQVRFRHMTLRHYLSVTDDNCIVLTEDAQDPSTVFKLHSLSQCLESEEVQFGSNARIEHLLTGTWLHGPIGSTYVKKETQSADGSSMQALRWDHAQLVPVVASTSQQYPDAFTIQKVDQTDRNTFNYVAGHVSFIRNLIAERQAGIPLNSKRTIEICGALMQLREFVMVGGHPCKLRQKLLRNLRVVDLLVQLLQCPLSDNSKDWHYQSQILKAIYKVLHAYTIGNSRKNALYFAKYIDFFETQLGVKGAVGLHCCDMLIDLIKDNRKIVDRIKPKTIDNIITLLSQNKHYRFLELLGVLCVCNGIGFTENQTRIAKKLLEEKKESLFHMRTGDPDIEPAGAYLSVSTDNQQNWIPLHKFVFKGNTEYNEEKYLFLERQLELYKLLCYGRNPISIDVITSHSEYLPWEVAMLGLKSEVLPDRIRAKFCDLIIGLFVDVGDHTGSAEMVTSNNFIYTDLLTESEQQSIAVCATDVVAKDLDQNYPSLRQWIQEFFEDNTKLVASLPSRNLLMQQVLRLVTYLLQYRYMGLEAEHGYIRQVINLLDGSKDVPFPPDRGSGPAIHRPSSYHITNYSHDKVRQVLEYRYRGRFLPGEQTNAIIAARLQALELLDLLLVRDFNRRIKNFVTAFKEIVEKQKAMKKNKRKILTRLFDDGFQVQTFWRDSKLRRKTQKLLSNLHPKTELVGRNLPKLLFDLTYYPSDDLSTKALFIMNKIYSSNSDLLQKALRSQVLLSYESSRIHQEALENMVTLRRLARSKLDQEHATQMCQILSQFTELCHVPEKPNVAHIVGQNILVNNGVLEVVMEVALQEVDIKLHDQYQICSTVISKALVLLRYLVQGNSYVQNYVFEHLDALLEVQACGSELALALKEVFIGSPLHCLRVHPRQMQALVRLVGQYQEKAPEFLSLLRSIVKIEASNMVLKRNQFLITKLIMENYKTAAYVMDMAKVDRMKILVGKKGVNHQKFLVYLVDLLAACAEGENRYIESLCQTLLSTEEILTMLNNRNVPLRMKAPIARYLVWAYMRTARTVVESGVDELPHDTQIWKHMRIILTMMQRVVEKELGNKSFISNVSMAESISTSSSVRSDGDGNVDVPAVMHYMLNGGILLLEVFYTKFYEPEAEINDEEPEILKRLVASFLPLCDIAAEYVTQSSHLLNVISCLETLMNKVALPRTTLERAQGRMDLLNALSRMKERIEKQVDQSYNKEELELNQHLHNLAQNCLHFLEGKNTVSSQLRVHIAGSHKKEYVSADDVAKLPLGLEFQTHVKCFYFSSVVKMGMEKKYGRALKLIDQLAVSARRYKQQASVSQEALDVKSLQILRALLYNLIIQLPEGWENQTNKTHSVLEKIQDLQRLFQKYDIIAKVMPMLARRNLEIGNQIMALLDVMLFNANRDVQKAVLEYFRGTKEEVFFVYLRNRLLIATMAHKERRSMEAQKRAKLSAQESAASMIQEHSATANGEVPKERASLDNQSDSNEIELKTPRKKGLGFRPKWRGKLLVSSFGMTSSDSKLKKKSGNPGFINLAFDAGFEEQELNLDDYNEGSDIYLVLQALAGLCDGQNTALQNYLREQPDNVRSVNLVSEVTQFINVLYSHVTGNTIDLLTQLFSTLNEICQGNQENRAVIMNNKIVDYMNFILRISFFEGCEPQQVLELWSILGTLLKSLTEENSPEAMLLAKDVRDTIDVEALVKVMTTCYTVYQADNPNVEELICKSVAVIGPAFSGAALLGKMKNVVMESKGIKESANDVGFIYYLVIARLVDVGLPVESAASANKKPYNYYKNQCMSIEIVKDDHLQKINFRVTNKALLREEVKEVVKWDIDRSSPSAKLRDLIHWSRDILKDIDYQRTILSNPIVRQLAKRWAIWNYLCIFLSLMINVMMLVTWDARLAIEDVDENATTLPAEVYNPIPLINYADYYLVLYILGGLHNACSIMLFFSYMLLKHPTLPNFLKGKKYWRKVFKTKNEEDSSIPPEKPQSSKLEVKLFSGVTVYYMAFVALSLAGTFFHGYFFAFHLLNIVANNQLLRGVIKAVTLNGKSLLWVGVMGLIIIYLYALIGFALMRPVFRPDEELFCSSLAQCTVTVIRYGLVGDIDEMFKRHDLEKTFSNFGYLTLYQITFFIIFTTIGLNIIFGIIVDTFSELRDLKWTAEKDMRDTCFICSRDSYDFEHAGHGFQTHVRNEHNMWAYIFYFIHLNEVKENNYSALDMYVHNLLSREKLDFFPLNRSLCLAHSAEDSNDTKIDDVMKTVYAIRARQEEEEAERRKAEERRRQLVWQETYRHRATRASTAPSTITDSDTELFPPPPGPDAAL